MDARRGISHKRPRYSTPRLAAAEARVLELVRHCEACYIRVRAAVVDGNFANDPCPSCGRGTAGRAMAVRFLAAAFGGG